MLRKFFLLLIRFYQLSISPLLPPRCRYLPTCSQYARECFETLPIHRAFYLSIRRILSCHPWSRGGYDPVPKLQHKCVVKNRSDLF